MTDFLYRYLDAIDEDLLAYLGHDGELSLPTVRRLHQSTASLLKLSASPAEVENDWPEYLSLLGAFVAAYGSDELGELEDLVDFTSAEERPLGARLTALDEKYLREVQAALEMHLEARRPTAEEDS